MCGRAILAKPAIVLGRAAFGPKCARRACLLQARAKKADVVRDVVTRDWVQEVTNV